jgi:hypothetical protein
MTQSLAGGIGARQRCCAQRLTLPPLPPPQGDWRGISRQFVLSRTPTQVASHAQKYFIRQNNLNKRKRRSSLFDIVAAPVRTRHAGLYAAARTAARAAAAPLRGAPGKQCLVHS